MCATLCSAPKPDAKMQIWAASEQRQAERDAIARANAARDKVMGTFSVIEKVRTLPPQHRGPILKESLAQLGYETVSPAFLRLASDPDFFDTATISRIRRLVKDDPVAADALTNQMAGGMTRSTA
jgi:hypothetical protein